MQVKDIMSIELHPEESCIYKIKGGITGEISNAKKFECYADCKKMNLKTRLYRQRYLYIMLIPAIIWVILMCYLPMFGLYMAFTIMFLTERRFSVIFRK